MKKLIYIFALFFVIPSQAATYYLSPSGNDSNNGQSTKAPWLTPKHPVNCGDVILAAKSSSYGGWNFWSGHWGTVTCPAGNNVAWLKCATFDGCKVIENNAGAFWVDRSYWGIQGFEVQATTGSKDHGCFAAAPGYSAPVPIHHIIFANNIANGCQQNGFGSFNQTATIGVDYLAIVGNIAYNAAQGTRSCFSGISIYQPIQSDSMPGTHIYVAGNFSWGNFDSNSCGGGTPTDGEGIILDTFDGRQGGLPYPYGARVVVENNILIANGGRGLMVGNNAPEKPPIASIYLRHNTMWGNNEDVHQDITFCGELSLYQAFNIQAFLNLAVTSATDGCGNHPIYAYVVGASATTTNAVNQNWGYTAKGTNKAKFHSSGFSYQRDNIFGVDPGFANPVSPGPPSCGGYSSVTACMATVIANFTPRNTAAMLFGYQMPSSAQVFDPLFPHWLCYVNLPEGLITRGCLNDPLVGTGTRPSQ